MNDYTPTTRDVKAAYIQYRVPQVTTEVSTGDEFDRWRSKDRRDSAVQALKDLAESVRQEFSSHGMLCPWVGALDDEATRLEQS